MTTRAQLLNAVNVYCMMPTKKRDVPSKSLQQLARRSMNVLLDYYKQDTFPNGVELVLLIRDYLAQSSHTRNARYKYAKTLAAILKDQYLIDSTAASELIKRFAIKTSSDWSDKAMSDDQLQVLFQRMDNYRSTYGDIKHYVTMCVMLFTGARISAALTAKNYKLTKDELSFFIVRQKSRTVEDIEKSIPLDIVMPNGQTFKDIAQQYIRLREQRSVRNAYLFPGTGSEPASQGGLRGYISKLNLPYKFTPHALRHTAGTMMAERVGVLEATRLLDHSSINITQKYIKRNTSNSHDSIRQVWAKQSAPNNPDLATTQSPELQAVIEKFQKDAQRLSDMVARLSS